MDKTIYLHIGFHKTATTTIQEGLLLNELRLARLGYYCPQAGNITNSTISHHNIVFQIRDDPRYDPLAGRVEDLVIEIRQAKEAKVIISSEDLCLMTLEQVRTLHSHLAPLGELRVIVYVRRQDQWLASFWSELVKTGNAMDFDESLRERSSFDFYQRFVPFYQRLTPWSAIFGRENIYVRVLERSQLVHAHPFLDFLDACDIKSLDGFRLPQNRNTSPSIKSLTIMRYLFASIDKHAGTSHRLYKKKIGVFLQKIGSVLQNYADEHNWNNERPNVVDRDTHDRIMFRFAESNRRLARDYLDRDELFLEPFEERAVTQYDVAQLTGEEALDLMAYTLYHLLQWAQETLSSGEVVDTFPKRPALITRACRELRRNGIQAVLRKLFVWSEHKYKAAIRGKQQFRKRPDGAERDD